MSSEAEPMKLFRAVYRDDNLVERKLDMYARDIAHATLSATELIPKQAKLIQVFHNPDW